MKLHPDVRAYVRSLTASALTALQIQELLDIMLDMDPSAGPLPRTPRGKTVAARTFVALMQGQPTDYLGS